MSLIIKGMDMPQAGDKIEFVQNIAGHIYARFEPSKGYMCEVVTLPEKHGRLIDADALIASFRESVQECKKISEDGYADALQEVNERAILATFIEAILRTKVQPTIVPAEGVTDDVQKQ